MAVTKVVRLLCLLVAATTFQTGTGHKITVLYDTSVNFTCDPMPAADLGLQTLDPKNFRRMWILPTGEVLQAETTDHKRVDVLEDGRVLHVRKVDDVDFGLYYCLIYFNTTGRYLALQHGINTNGPYWGDLFQKYRANLITGAIAAAVCFTAMGTLCFFYNRHQAKGDKLYEDKKKKKAGEQQAHDLKPSSTLSSDYANTAYIADDESASVNKEPPHWPGSFWSPPSGADMTQDQHQQSLSPAVSTRTGGGHVIIAHAQSDDAAFVNVRF